MAMQPSLARLLRGYRAVLGVSDIAMLQIASMDTHRQTDEQKKGAIIGFVQKGNTINPNNINN